MSKHKASNLFTEKPRARALRMLRQWLQDGSLKAGELLPAEQQLATRLEVSRTTVRAALKMLEQEGLVAPVTGSRGRRIVCAANVPGLLRNTVALLADASLLDRSFSWMFPRWSLDVVGHVWDLLYAKGLHALRLHPQNMHPRQLDLPQEELPIGLIVFEGVDRAPASDAILGAFERSAVPAAALAESAPLAGASTVSPDYRRGTYELTRWLLAQGRKHILPCWTHVVGHPAPASCRARLAGYREAMIAAGMQAWDPLLCGLPAAEHGSVAAFEAGVHMAAGHLVRCFSEQTQIDAIIALSDHAAQMISAAVQILGRRPKVDLDIAGFGNTPVTDADRSCFPSITLAVDSRDLAARLVDLVLNPPAEPVHYRARPNLVIPEDKLPVFGALPSRRLPTP